MRCTEPLAAGCPHCGHGGPALVWWVAPDNSTRTYCCRSCGRRWSVDGAQEELFPVGAVEMAALRLEVK